MKSLFTNAAAGLSECERYRYWLTREWDSQLSGVTFVMLNPSTADAEQDDPTIRRCIGFARAWGYGSLCVVNLFAWRSTQPDALHAVADPVGEINDQIIREWATGRTVIAAWGASTIKAGRAANVTSILTSATMNVFCLGYTNSGCPRHPLYVRADAEKLVFPKPAKAKEGA